MDILNRIEKFEYPRVIFRKSVIILFKMYLFNWDIKVNLIKNTFTLYINSRFKLEIKANLIMFSVYTYCICGCKEV